LLYGDMEGWQYVKAGTADSTWFGGFFDFRLNSIGKYEVEVLKYVAAGDGTKDEFKEYQIYIQGVPMLPFGTPPPWKWEGYNITMSIGKSLTRTIAYGKSLALFREVSTSDFR